MPRKMVRNNLLKTIGIITITIFLLLACDKDSASEEPELPEFGSPGVYDIPIKVDTMIRWFKIIVPPKYDHSESRPLLLAFHGGNLSMGFMFNNRKDLIQRCEAENWILVFTNGANATGSRGNATWNAIHCCNRAFWHQVDDIGYVRKIVDTLNSILKIDKSRIYAIGGSNGAMLVHKLAAKVPDIFAAVAENQGTIGGRVDSISPIEMIQPSQPIPFLMIHGMSDLKVPFQGGQSIEGTRIDLSFRESVLKWATVNQCDMGQSDTTIVQGLNGKVWIIDFDQCNSKAIVRGIAVENKGHGWPGLEESGYDGTNASTDFFKQFSK